MQQESQANILLLGSTQESLWVFRHLPKYVFDIIYIFKKQSLGRNHLKRIQTSSWKPVTCVRALGSLKPEVILFGSTNYQMSSTAVLIIFSNYKWQWGKVNGMAVNGKPTLFFHWWQIYGYIALNCFVIFHRLKEVENSLPQQGTMLPMVSSLDDIVEVVKLPRHWTLLG